MILQATGGIADKRLRDYACRRLSGDMPAPPVKPARGRGADDNRWRNICIVGYLIPPLLRAEFPPTRNEATDAGGVFDRLAGIGNDRKNWVRKR